MEVSSMADYNGYEFQFGKPDENEEKAKELKNQRAKELNDLKWVVSDVRGRRFINMLLNEGNAFKSVFYGDKRDDYEKGKEYIGKLLLNKLLSIDNGEVLIQIRKENKPKKSEE
jgi:hypothetical protein